MITKEEIITKILDINGYEKLNPMQDLAKEHIGTSTIVTTPTASGKTTIFEMYMLDCILNKKKKVVYISPLKALTTEHYKETKRKFSKELDVKIGISTGDLDSSSKFIESYDVLFLTFEKFDSIIRHKPSFLKTIGLLTIDEIHELGSSRGSILEVILTQIKNSHSEIILLGLSATIKNGQEIADWLSAKLVLSNYRPVPLETGVFYNDNIYFEDRKEDLTSLTVKNTNLGSIIKDTLNKQKQLIVFCASRKNTMSFAKKYGLLAKEYISEKEYEKLRIVAKEALETLESPTKQCEELFSCILNGTSFHHAGLVTKQRNTIEDNFKNGNIKIIFATPTLAAGINLPAFRVIINSIFRFSNGSMVPIPVNEFQQMAGRAGRPRYDIKGEAICVVNKEADVSKIYTTYILSGPSNIESQLSKINILRSHLLSIILINDLKSIEEVYKYLTKTFYFYTFGNNFEIKNNILEIISEFIEFEFLEKEDNFFKITEIGKKVCYLYIDPLSANNIINDYKIKKEKEINDYEKIFTITNTLEMAPYLNYKADKENELFILFEKIKQNIYFDYEDIYLLQKLNLTKLLFDWIQEIDENKLIEDHNTTPGQIRDVVSRAEWICHATLELFKFKQANVFRLREYSNLLKRIKYGIKEELVELVEIKNIGRVRARRLFNSGIKTINDVKKNPSKFIGVVGRAGLESLKELKIDYQEGKEQEKINF
jgi:helicase